MSEPAYFIRRVKRTHESYQILKTYSGRKVITESEWMDAKEFDIPSTHQCAVVEGRREMTDVEQILFSRALFTTDDSERRD